MRIVSYQSSPVPSVIATRDWFGRSALNGVSVAQKVTDDVPTWKDEEPSIPFHRRKPMPCSQGSGRG